MHRNILLLCIVGLGLFAEAKKLSTPRVTCNGGVCIKNHGRSGKFSVSRGNESEDAINTITIEFDSIKEVDADGNEVGTTGPKLGKHAFNSFAPLDFDFTDVVDTNYKGISAKAFNFSAEIPGPNATLNVPIFFFSDNGTVNLCDDEEITIRRGIIKYNIELFNWDFCKAGSGCKKGKKEEIGKYVDFVITVKNKGKGKKGTKSKKQAGKRRKAQKFYFGNSTSISFPSALMSNSSCTQMPEDYPKLETKTSKYSITFRFPMFNDKAVYDPAIDVMQGSASEPPEPSEPTTSTTGPTTGCSKPLPSFAAVLLLGALFRLFF
ncbi:skeletal aspartic acid-rich protein 2-like isoform X3 [Actinia tenebrosa]|uniref:Skeletal aspartic acid-rich protein 2-like isoform X3 n=1 Tax=Actinia tenebrosa TaxID=6105 RepID=A0A6P8IFT0_ACTTE|nr:skeletal aspartic acid-rich protein 2-like isoform X3 [Actinia tenebrosa]